MKRSAFTIIEIISVFAILGVLAALLFPVYSGSRQQAKVTAAMENLRQNHVQFTLYQNDWDNPSDVMLMLPEYGSAIFGKTVNDSPCRPYPGDGVTPPFEAEYVRGFIVEFDRLPQLYDYYGDNLILVVDLLCNDRRIDVLNPSETKFGIGVSLNGTTVRKRDKGEYRRISWWYNPQGQLR
jgi:type II secretory pathway pseudopilin PulG